ncbi:MAG: N-acetylglucosamine kinase [Chitinophagaceae bacterium]
MSYLIADSGSTNCEWALVSENKTKKFSTIGINPYFLSQEQIITLFNTKVLPKTKQENISQIYFYGTGLSNIENLKIIKNTIKKVLPNAKAEINTDMLGAARSLLLKEKGIACILGTGSNAAYYNGNKIIKNSPGLGYILGDEGSGSYLGKKVLQHYLYKTFDEELTASFNAKFNVTKDDILNSIYKQPLANRYLATFSIFLSENRGHYMIENIIEDGLHDFFFHHLYKFRESWQYPISFTGSIAFAFKDIIKEICNNYELQLGKILKQPIDGLITYHKGN